MDPHVKEWIIQDEYELGSANVLFDGERYFHPWFFCHLALEKALKAVIFGKTEGTLVNIR
ncbi:MAG TPA: HEPN domain-containing protein [Methanospirillum sp.]|nr:HEPN domain-containing protein [Methanospirillum sp.]